MWGIPYQDVDYCCYGMPYRKRTRLWNNVFSWVPRDMCKKDCWAMNETKTRHRETAQRAPCKGHGYVRRKQSELYVVPSDLIREILTSI